MTARHLVSLFAAGALLAGCASQPEMVVVQKTRFVEAEQGTCSSANGTAN